MFDQIPPPTTAKWLADSRRSIAVWTVAICAVGGIYAALWPTIDSPGMQQALDSYPEGMLEVLNYDDLSTAAGYLTSSVYGLLAAILMMIHAIAAGARAIAGDEQAGTLELVAAHPISRTRLALQRFLSVLMSIGFISVVFLGLMLALRAPAQLDEVSVGGLLAMHLHLALFAALFGAIAFAVGAATGRRSLALGVAAAVAVVGYLANGVLPMIDGLAWVRRLSPFDWLVGTTPLTNGIDAGALAIMAALIVVVTFVGVRAFEGRDLAT